MKKSLLIALVGFMFFAFASCGGSDNSDSKNDKKTEQVTGTKEYQDGMNLLNKVETAINNAKTCEDLDAAWAPLFSFDQPEYEENERMTIDEEKKLRDASEKLRDLADKKARKVCI